jgi:hypothetical protein
VTALIFDGFAPEARAMRRVFDERFDDPRKARGDRFVWDFWHVPGQYTHLRTPAWTYFPRALYRAFHERLVRFGRRVLGCHDISPPWLSCYVDGCEQRLHGDLPHGPWAFVFSLTNWQKRTFRGGETLLVQDDVLDFWSDFESVRSVEEPSVVRAIEPRFGRLVVFDPRIPHGVRQVRGTLDPREGRLVVHGWFVRPRPFVEGPLPRSALAKAITGLADAMQIMLARGPALAGLLSFGFKVSARGTVSDVRLLSDTTRVPKADEPERVRFVRAVRREIGRWAFPKQRGPSRVTLPIAFER